MAAGGTTSSSGGRGCNLGPAPNAPHAARPREPTHLECFAPDRVLFGRARATCRAAASVLVWRRVAVLRRPRGGSPGRGSGATEPERRAALGALCIPGAGLRRARPEADPCRRRLSQLEAVRDRDPPAQPS